MKMSKERIMMLASSLCGKEKCHQICSLLDRIAPNNDPTLLAEPSGAFWIGVGFSPKRESALKVYINGKWGTETRQWERLELFAKYYSNFEQWQKVRRLIDGKMIPVGMSLTAINDNPLTGRIYVRSYSNSISFYEDFISTSLNIDSKGFLKQFMEIFLGEFPRYLVRPVVCSFGLGSSIESPVKFEICGHCIFDSDVVASERCSRWARSIGLDPDQYLKVLRIISGERLSKYENNMHSFVGFGLDEEKVSSSVYLKPVSKMTC
jgi:hypothetical protein